MFLYWMFYASNFLVSRFIRIGRQTIGHTDGWCSFGWLSLVYEHWSRRLEPQLVAWWLPSLDSHPWFIQNLRSDFGEKNTPKKNCFFFVSVMQKMMDDVQLFDVFVLRMSQPWSMMEAINLQWETKGYWVHPLVPVRVDVESAKLCILSWCKWISNTVSYETALAKMKLSCIKDSFRGNFVHCSLH